MEERVVLCGANAYEQKYYFNEKFNGLPQAIKDELHIICVLFTEEVGGVFTIVFEEDGKETEISKGTTVSMNFWGFTGSMMDELEKRFPPFLDKALKENPMKGEYLLPGTADELIKEGKADVKVLKSLDRWYGVTYKEDKESVVNALQSMKDNGLYPEILWR